MADINFTMFIVRPVKRDWAVLSKVTPLDISISKSVDSNGTSFTLATSDDKNVRVVMQQPLNEYVAGLTEVHGTVDDRNSIQCENYITFSQEVSDAFNLPLYNTAVELMARAPQHYTQGIQQG